MEETRPATVDAWADIKEFYRCLDEALPHSDAANPCGECGDCCRYLFYLSGYEFAYLAQALTQAKTEAPVVFRVSRTPAEDPRLGEGPPACPLYRPDQGCLAYAARPYACRVMGTWWPNTTPYLEGCVYQNAQVYSRLEELPLWEEYVALLRRHPSFPGYLDLPVAK